ncbi:MAG TPA: DNA-binding response regulator [Cytophagales bacterium]|nr:DNA-binding response regulator [Cytophagales bacterium]HAP60765.1 DNA-binding response regulator [Cytophagales bacterium]
MAESTKLLLVEDDPNLGSILHEYLTLKGYSATLARDGQAGWERFLSDPYDLCILDVMLPKMDGFTLAEKIRDRDGHVPFLFLTAKSMKEDAIHGLKLGADDYLTKPFSMEELLLRMEAILRRTKAGPIRHEQAASLSFGQLSFDPTQQQLSGPQGDQRLTGKEAALLHLLCQHLNQTLDRKTALKEIWGDDSYFNARSMDVYIAKLRKHLKQDPGLELLTVHGQGFKLVELH